MNFYNPYQQYQNQYQPQSSRIWVQGEAGARSYLVAPNNTVELWDSEAPVIYLKSADASGMPSMRVLDYQFRDSAPQRPQGPLSEAGPKTPTLEDIKGLQEQIDALKKEIGGLHDTKSE